VRLLLVEDDPDVGPMLQEALRADGHVTDLVRTGEDGLWLHGEQPYDVVVLDVGLPDTDGFAVCRRLREQGSSTPVLMLTGRAGVDDRVHGLDSGADDYLAKPFQLDELKARLRALGRRAERPVVLTHEVAGVEVDPSTRTVRREGREVPLVGREYAFVELLARNPGRVVPRSTVVSKLWDFDSDVSDNTVDVLVSAVRAKLDRPFGAPVLRTVRGVGYRLG
jgi:two-component system OmpR family response regulator